MTTCEPNALAKMVMRGCRIAGMAAMRNVWGLSAILGSTTMGTVGVVLVVARIT